jgi:hypothetical protein
MRRDEVIRLRGDGLSWRAVSRRLNVPVSTLMGASGVRKLSQWMTASAG